MINGTVMEELVTKDIAKLLYELGFDGFCLTYYEEHVETPRYSTSGKLYRSKLEEREKEHNKNSEWKVKYYLAPTQQMVKSWLREVHKIFIREDYRYFDNLCNFNNYLTECYVEAKSMTNNGIIYYQYGPVDNFENIVNNVISAVLDRLLVKKRKNEN